MDQYLIPDSAYQRLLKEYKEHGQLYIGCDFDGTVHNYHNEANTTYDMVINLLGELKEINCKIIIWTAHYDLIYVRKFLIDNEIPFDTINEGGLPLPWESKKPFFSALLDDRAGLIQVYNDLDRLVKFVKSQ